MPLDYASFCHSVSAANFRRTVSPFGSQEHLPKDGFSSIGEALLPHLVV
jgi:hypothetical protein